MRRRDVTFETLPEGYEIRRVKPIGSTTSKRMSPESCGALMDIAAATPCWTEWGYGHATSMWSGSCERRGYVEVAVPVKTTGRDKTPVGRFLYRATRKGVLLANEWRKASGMPKLPVPAAPGDPGKPAASIEVAWIAPEAVAVDVAVAATVGPGVRGTEWPENLDTWELHDAILAERDVERVRMLNAELQARLDAVPGVAAEAVRA